MAKLDLTECEKLSIHDSERDIILDFLGWLEWKKGYNICESDDSTGQGCMLFVMASPDDLVMDFLGIDQKKLEKERSALLKQCQEAASVQA